MAECRHLVHNVLCLHCHLVVVLLRRDHGAFPRFLHYYTRPMLLVQVLEVVLQLATHVDDRSLAGLLAVGALHFGYLLVLKLEVFVQSYGVAKLFL